MPEATFSICKIVNAYVRYYFSLSPMYVTVTCISMFAGAQMYNSNCDLDPRNIYSQNEFIPYV